MSQITVITPTLPGRENLLAEACQSVAAQTLKPDAHLIATDYKREGPGKLRTRLALNAQTMWVAPLDDDDLLYPDHLACLAWAGTHHRADIVYSWCAVENRDWNPSSLFDAARLRRENFIPITTLIRRELVAKLGGWRDRNKCENGWEDWDFWRRALDADAKFVCLPTVTWAYRFHQANTWGETLAA